jgi:hypothetical protein
MFTRACYFLGRLFEKMFDLWRWLYSHISPNKIFIFTLFVGVAVWIYVQNKYNKEAEKNGTYK